MERLIFPSLTNKLNSAQHNFICYITSVLDVRKLVEMLVEILHMSYVTPMDMFVEMLKASRRQPRH